MRTNLSQESCNSTEYKNRLRVRTIKIINSSPIEPACQPGSPFQTLPTPNFLYCITFTTPARPSATNGSKLNIISAYMLSYLSCTSIRMCECVYNIARFLKKINYAPKGHKIPLRASFALVRDGIGAYCFMFAEFDFFIFLCFSND